MDVQTTLVPQTPPMERRWLESRWLFLTAALVLLVLLFGRSMMRPFDMDEHQFVAPSVFLTDSGSIPYRDYPYFHMPTLVYIHACATALTPWKLLAARTVSVVCGWAAVILMFRIGWRALKGHTPETRWFLIGGITVAFLCSQLFVYTTGWAWNHDSAVLCTLGAVLVQLRGMRRGSLWPLALAGLLAGLAIGIRLSFAFIVVPMAIALCCGRTPLTLVRRGLGLALAAGAATLVLIPAIIPWWSDPGSFVFGNLGYATLNAQYYAAADASYMSLGGKVYYLFRKFFSDPGNAFCFLLGCYALGYVFWKLRAWKSRFANELGLLLGLMPALLIGAWGPTPTQQQYFYMLLPFLTIAGMYGVALDCASGANMVRWRRVVFWAALVPAIIGFPRWYWQAAYLPVVSEWTPVRVHQTGEWIREQCPAHARILTADPVFPLEVGLEAYPEYSVGRFIFHVGHLMTPADRRRFHMAYEEELERVLAERPPDAIFRHTKAPTEALALYAQRHGFRKVGFHFVNHDYSSSREEFELWVRDERTTRSK